MEQAAHDIIALLLLMAKVQTSNKLKTQTCSVKVPEK
jgi:hypothetical protein